MKWVTTTEAKGGVQSTHLTVLSRFVSDIRWRDRGAIAANLDKGADVNAQGGFYGNALQAAERVHELKVLEMPKDAGANVPEMAKLFRKVSTEMVDAVG